MQFDASSSSCLFVSAVRLSFPGIDGNHRAGLAVVYSSHLAPVTVVLVAGAPIDKEAVPLAMMWEREGERNSLKSPPVV